MSMFERFRLSRSPVVEEEPLGPTDRMIKAAEELNAAWAENPDRTIKPWIQWDERRVTICECRYIHTELEQSDSIGDDDD